MGLRGRACGRRLDRKEVNGLVRGKHSVRGEEGEGSGRSARWIVREIEVEIRYKC